MTDISMKNLTRAADLIERAELNLIAAIGEELRAASYDGNGRTDAPPCVYRIDRHATTLRIMRELLVLEAGRRNGAQLVRG